MSTVDATFHVPGYIVQGLSNGAYEQVGGVVREIKSKQIVAWLREASDVGQPVISNLLSLTSVGAVSSVLNLAVSTMGFNRSKTSGCR